MTTMATTNLKSTISKELKTKANEFLNSSKHASNLVEIIAILENNLKTKKENLTSAILTLEVIFAEILKREEMCLKDLPKKSEDYQAKRKHSEWLQQRYEETWQLLLRCLQEANENDESVHALGTCMNLLAAEAKHPLQSRDEFVFPNDRLVSILKALCTCQRSQLICIQRFKEYASYADILFYSWKQLQFLGKKLLCNELTLCNYLEVVNALPLTQDLLDANKLFCCPAEAQPEGFPYGVLRKYINAVWKWLVQTTEGSNEVVHRQVLIVLLERILPHLDRPVQLTDFFIESLNRGGVVALLALQGIFVLIQKHNIAYPNIYEKLYSMFEPDIFYTKHKARLFYLGDIFLSSTHLPEGLVAAFAKRLARLSLVAPPQDIVIILYFIGNLMLRHSGLKRLICAPAALEVSADPYNAQERDPLKSHALESSLWEIVLLQQHALPSVANAARFISQPLPTIEWDMASVLDMTENSIFDEEMGKTYKQYALEFEKPDTMFRSKDDLFKSNWSFF